MIDATAMATPKTAIVNKILVNSDGFCESLSFSDNSVFFMLPPCGSSFDYIPSIENSNVHVMPHKNEVYSLSHIKFLFPSTPLREPAP